MNHLTKLHASLNNAVGDLMSLADDCWIPFTARSFKSNEDLPAQPIGKSNAYYENGAYFIEVAVPGIKEEQIDLSVKDKIITVNISQEIKKEETAKTFAFQEYRHKSYSRNFTLPPNTNVDEQPEAELKNGILKIGIQLCFPPAKEERKKIDIKKID